MLLDSNILIYGGKASDPSINSILVQNDLAIASVTKIETLGYHHLIDAHRKWFEVIISKMRVIDLEEPIIQRAIALRQSRKMGLADAIIAATAIENNLRLVTCNVNDYKNIPGLQLLDPKVQS